MRLELRVRFIRAAQPDRARKSNELSLDSLARLQRPALTAQHDRGRKRLGGRSADDKTAVVDVDVHPVIAVGEAEAEAFELVRESGVEPQGAVSDLEARVAALKEVHGAGHGTQVDALGSRTALSVGDIGG